MDSVDSQLRFLRCGTGSSSPCCDPDGEFTTPAALWMQSAPTDASSFIAGKPYANLTFWGSSSITTSWPETWLGCWEVSPSSFIRAIVSSAGHQFSTRCRASLRGGRVSPRTKAIKNPSTTRSLSVSFRSSWPGPSLGRVFFRDLYNCARHPAKIAGRAS